MKKYFLFFLFNIVISFCCLAQIPDAFKYQAVLRNSSGEIISNQDVSIRVSIYEGNDPGTNLFSETHSVSTDKYGAISVSIGNGTLETGNFSEIDWLIGNKFLKVEVDDAGGSSYTNMGMVKLLSVPYALSSKSAENLGDDNIYIPTSDTLFVVKDYDGNVVFAVFPDGAAVYVNEGVKGKVGGFAISGRSPNKAIEEDYLIVTADSTRVYVNEAEKGKVGGFAVSGRSPNKGETTKFMNLNSQNYFIGHQAGISNTNGQFNSFLGYKAGYSNTVGNRNTFIGYYSGYTNVNGNSNIFIGDSAGYFNENGYYNIFLGNNSGTLNSEGYQNVFIGNESGYSNFDGKYNVFIGQKTGSMNTDGSRNVIIGATSGYYNSGGSNNVFVGNWCGYYNADGSDNVFLGNRTGWNNETGSYNIFIGTYCGFGNTTGSDNIFIGAHAGSESDTCFANIFIGNNSGEKNSSGLGNVYLGNRTGNENTSGTNNTILGHESGHFNTEGNTNVFVGAYSGHYNEVGSRNVYVGKEAGHLSLGSGNVFLGAGAGYFEDESDKLYVDNWSADSSQALIWGDFVQNRLRINGQLGVNIEPTGNTIEAYYGEGSGSIMIQGTGNAYSYSRLVLMSDEVVDQQWQIYHNLSNNFEIVCYDGTTWYNDIFELDKNGVLTTAGSILPKTDNTNSLGNSTYKWSEVYATNGTIQTSDFRLKNQIEDINYGLDAILKLRPVSFRWKNESSGDKKLGLIAQEVQPVISEVVHVGNDANKTLGINYSDLVPVLIKGMQEQQDIIKNQQDKITELEKRLTQLENLVK